MKTNLSSGTAQRTPKDRGQKYMKDKKGQQEIVGFVLIVGLVLIGLMVFLIISIRDNPVEENSIEAENLLTAIMGYTTECAITFEPDYDNYEDLFKSCYRGKSCKNLNENSCDYLNSSLQGVVKNLLSSESTIGAYQLDFLERDDGVETGILRIFEGNCTRATGGVIASQKSLISGADSLVVRMKLCLLS